MSVVDELQFEPLGAHADGTDISSAVAVTRETGATKLMLQVQTQNARYTLDGTTPTATKGFQLVAGNDPYILHIHPNSTFTIIEETATADAQWQWGK